MEIACCYNIEDSLLKSEKIERIVIKEADELCLDEIVRDGVDEEYINICNDIDYYMLVEKLKMTKQSFVVSWESYTTGKETILSILPQLDINF